MTNREAISILKTCAFTLHDGLKTTLDETNEKTFRKSYERAIKALEDQRWIPVSEQLPEDCEDVFVTVKMQDAGKEPEYNVDLGSYSRCWQADQHGRLVETGGIWSYCNDWYEGQDVCEVIAWMTTPEPYKEK